MAAGAYRLLTEDPSYPIFSLTPLHHHAYYYFPPVYIFTLVHVPSLVSPEFPFLCT
jgi:hypothetical protein